MALFGLTHYHLFQLVYDMFHKLNGSMFLHKDDHKI
jgi:hypothetical protein